MAGEFGLKQKTRRTPRQLPHSRELNNIKQFPCTVLDENYILLFFAPGSKSMIFTNSIIELLLTFLKKKVIIQQAVKLWMVHAPYFSLSVFMWELRSREEVSLLLKVASN